MNRSTGELEDFVECTPKCDLTKMTLKIYQLHLIIKMTQGFNEDVKSLMTFNTPYTSYKGVVSNQETDKKNRMIYRRDTVVA